ncbi:hypothetical protein OK006_8666, partial [Actinobacteria bacterium OK006]
MPIAPDATTSVLPSSKRQRTMIQNHRAPWAHSTEVTAAIAPGDPDPTNPAPTRTTEILGTSSYTATQTTYDLTINGLHTYY